MIFFSSNSFTVERLVHIDFLWLLVVDGSLLFTDLEFPLLGHGDVANLLVVVNEAVGCSSSR